MMDQEIDKLRKRLYFKAHHRGTKEADLVIGPFAQSALAHFSQTDLQDFERILDLPDPDLYDWLIAGVPVPANQDSQILQQLRAFGQNRNLV